MAAETQYTVQLGMQQVSTANSNLDGTTGTYSNTIVTGASNGSLVLRAKIKSTMTCSQGMIRFFVTGGGSTRLIMEVPVEATKPSADQRSFEQTVELNFPLQSGYTMKASTQVGETFNIFMEALDWTYFTSSVRPESTQYVANTGMNSISTANTNLNGTGTVVTILTAGASATYKGCLVENVIIKSTAFATGTTTTPGMVRLFIYDGTNTYLYTEIEVPAVTQSATQQSFYRKIPLNLNLQAGWILKAAPEVGDTFSVIAEGKDWKYPSANQITNYTPASNTATTSEEILHSLQVPANLFASGGLMSVYANLAFTNSANSKTYRIYAHSSNTLTGATLLATIVATTSAGGGFSRFFPILSDTSVDAFGGTTTSLATQYAQTTGTSANVTVPSVSAGFYILISGQKASSGETSTVRWSMVKKEF
jgi:hypothetical protein